MLGSPADNLRPISSSVGSAAALQPACHNAPNSREFSVIGASASVGGEDSSYKVQRGEPEPAQLRSTASAAVLPRLARSGSGIEAQRSAECALPSVEVGAGLSGPAITFDGSQNVINGGSFTAVGRDIVYNIQTSEEHSKSRKPVLRVRDLTAKVYRPKAQEDAEMALAHELPFRVREEPDEVDSWHRISLSQKRRVSEMAPWQTHRAMWHRNAYVFSY